MQTVSQGWKDNQNERLVSESFVEVILSLSDPDALEDATATDNGAATISNTAEIVNEVDEDIKPYATLEKNLWVLDGSREVFASNVGNTGYIGSMMSAADLSYTTSPQATVSFSEVHTKVIPGITIVWSTAFNEFAVDFTVKAYNGSTEVASVSVTGNTESQSIILMDIANYNKILISVSKWCSPNHRPRIEKVLVGVEKVYSKTDLFSFSHTQDIDPFSAELPKSEISFSMDNSEDEYNPNNLQGLAKYLIERQEIKARYGFKVNGAKEWVDCGTFYMCEWDAPQKGITASFTARDILEFMTDNYYYGVYNPSGTSLYNLATDVLTKANLPLNADGTQKWQIDDSLKNIFTVAPLPIDTSANCLQLIANAAGCTMYQDRKGVLHIKPLGKSVTDYTISHFNSYSPSEISLSKPLKNVEVSSYNYTVATDMSELYKDTVAISGTKEILITYSSATNVTASVSGGTLNSAKYYSNACVLNITASGNVTITVTGYNLESSSAKVITASGVSGETISVDNPLITSHARASAIGVLMEEYMSSRKILKSSWRADPRVDAGDVVKNENDYNTNNVLMTNVAFSYNGAFRGSGEGRVV